MPVESKLLRRLAIVGVCALSLAVCCGLAYWQWMRYSSAGGSFQNLGYVLQWPLFGLFPAFVFWRIRQLSRRSSGPDAEPASGESAPSARSASARGRRRRATSTATAPAAPRRPALARQGAPDPHDPEDPDDAELAAYNRYLAELYARDQKNH